ncbi:CHRD domain-containing protein [Rubricoccus marinus]|uniref:LTD domain-containing protein n=1 Tax=Rubricoccus marinus TaxID=716817 RepID=A0A259U1M1_9BACT|nr:CHRD domain-containing protein [Rubricoccus marinus]OZC03872.1 hypothetical protein BSZ36_13280 [Rubricoccus marinus]
MSLRYLLRSCFALALLLTASGAVAQSDLVITGVADGPLSGGTPKVLELYAINDIPDLSVYGVAVAANGNASSGAPSFMLGADAASAGDYIYVATETEQFNNFFGFEPDYTGSLFINGDDAVELYLNGAVVDVFGEVGVDGTGQPWEHLDGWAYRMDGTGPEGATFTVSNWTYSGVDGLEGGSTNATTNVPFPVGTYSTTPSMGPQTFTALARGEFEVPAVETMGKGGITAVLDGTMLTVTGAFAYLESDYNAAVGAHLHGGASGENGPVRYSLTPTLDADNRGGFFAAGENMFNVRETFADSLRAGLVYFNLHTVDNGSGEIRGQLGMNADALPVALSGDQEVPPFETSASGSATVTVDGTTVTVTGSFMGLTGDYQASHVHAGARGMNGPVVFALNPTVPMAMARSGEWEAANNMFEVSTTFADSLRAGLAYINVHSDASPSGEIRGQIGFENEMDAEPMDIADVRAGGDDQQVTIVGVVTRSQGRITYVQDETAALAIFQTSGAFRTAVDAGDIAAGDSLRVTGMTGSFNGFFQIDGVDSFEVISRDNALPLYQRVTLAEIAANGEQYESELLEVRGLMFSAEGAFAASTTYQIGDQSGAVALRTPSASDTRIAGVDIPQEAAIFRGVLGQFDNEDPRDSGYQLTPIRMSDVVAQGDPSQLVINEILYDPASELAGDANGDGTRDGVQDEFVEIVNAGTSSVDLGNFVIEDGASLGSDDVTFIRHRFPVGTVLEAGQAVVVFGGGTPTGDFGTSIVQTASNTGGLGLNNGGDTVTLADAPIQNNAGGNVIATVTYDGSVQDEAIARIPDLTGDFAAHTTNPQNPVRFSPGVSNLTGGGGGFPSASEETPDGTIVLTVANPLRADAQVRFETPVSGDVSLVLYDALGRRVAVLAEGDLAAGAHTATLRASSLAPGVYVLRLAASGTQMTRTLTVVR